MRNNSWIEVDLRGLQKILSRRGKEFLVYKLVQNGFVQARLWPTRRKAEGLADYVADASRVPGSDSLDAAEISKIMLEELERRKPPQWSSWKSGRLEGGGNLASIFPFAASCD
jgi:hypothetical protein